MSTNLKQVVDFIINKIDESRNNKGNKYYIVSDVVDAVNQFKNIRKFYHASQDNEEQIMKLINKIFEKDGIVNPATPEILYKEIELLIRNIMAVIK